jgi:hypothetical protein
MTDHDPKDRTIAVLLKAVAVTRGMLYSARSGDASREEIERILDSTSETGLKHLTGDAPYADAVRLAENLPAADRDFLLGIPPMTYQDIALHFATNLVTGNLAVAHAALSPALQAHYTPDGLQSQLDQMVAYTSQSAAGASVSVDSVMDNWADKQPDDAGWAYVSIFRDEPEGAFSEAVTVIITTEGRIRDLIWGRP